MVDGLRAAKTPARCESHSALAIVLTSFLEKS
jgi:hypothetical protein